MASSQAAVESASPSPSVPPSVGVDPTSARFVCEKLRLRDAHLERGDSLSPVEEEQVVLLGMEAAHDARLEDAEPALREIARGYGEHDVVVAKMIAWCKEHTEPLLDTSPW
ncbi:hypothetical protein [Nocardiopsis quinghaiensis]|uniref:hypothetical protein n=1 Tax=Nocardiopsis quinghaiensis TaxID=464995 RepID=UPI001CC223B8|nr:hypothetical protein [Nocardiopsis quinghaiensis]